MEVFEYYTSNTWDFDNAHVLRLRKILNAVEQDKFRIDGINVDITEYFYHCVRAARRFILKESDESIPAAKRHMKM